MKIAGIIALLFVLVFLGMIGMMFGSLESKAYTMSSEDWARYITGSPLHHKQKPTLLSFDFLDINTSDNGIVTERWVVMFDYPDATARWVTTVKYKETCDRNNLSRGEIVYMISEGVYAIPKK